jgi:signal transduction histidine kinase
MNQEGSGLGLAIVRDVAERYGGTVDLCESDSGGLLVRIDLPWARPGQAG